MEEGEDGLLAEMAEVRKRMEQRTKREKKKTKEQKKRSRIRAAQLAMGMLLVSSSSCMFLWECCQGPLACPSLRPEQV